MSIIAGRNKIDGWEVNRYVAIFFVDGIAAGQIENRGRRYNCKKPI
jgi:hypothetical protein